MKTRYIVALSMVAGAALGAAAIQGLHAQAKPPIYVIAEISDITNPQAYAKDYASKVQPIIKGHGAKYLALGGVAGAGAAGKVTSLDGDPPQRVVIQVWDSMEKVQAWRNDPAFKALRAVGSKYAKFRTYAIEGLPK